MRDRQAIPGDRGRVRHRAIDPAALGPRHPRPAVGDGGGRFRTSGAGIHTKAGVIRANEAKLANLLDREFDGYAPHAHLASDLTYVRVGGQAAEEGARVPEPLHHDRAAEA